MLQGQLKRPGSQPYPRLLVEEVAVCVHEIRVCDYERDSCGSEHDQAARCFGAQEIHEPPRDTVAAKSSDGAGISDHVPLSKIST